MLTNNLVYTFTSFINTDNSSTLTKMGNIVFFNLVMSTFELPELWAHKEIGQVASECIPKRNIYQHFQTYRGVNCVLIVRTDGKVTIQPVSNMDNTDVGYLRALFVYSTV